MLHWPLGVNPLLAANGRRQVHALGLATTCLMLMVGTLGYLIDHWLLVPANLTSLRLFAWLSLGLLVTLGSGCSMIKPAGEPKLRVVLLPHTV